MIQDSRFSVVPVVVKFLSSFNEGAHASFWADDLIGSSISTDE